MADNGCWKTKTSLERGSGLDKGNKGQRKLEDSGGGLRLPVEGHSLE